MIRGDVADPVLTMNNDEIARRHITAYLLQRYLQARLPDIPDESQRQLFEVLGKVDDFLDDSSTLNRTDFEEWLRENEATLRTDIADWLPGELPPASRAALLSGVVDETLRDIDKALDREQASGGAK
jgi:hypothetical protein